jgi:hypothetical protein
VQAYLWNRRSKTSDEKGKAQAVKSEAETPMQMFCAD